MPASATEPLPEFKPLDVPADAGPGELFSPYRRVSSLLRQAPTTLGMTATWREVIKALETAHARAAVIVDEARQLPLGIITLRDALSRVSRAADLDLPVIADMTGGLITLPAEATVHQATVRMVRRRVHHLVLVDHQGGLAGVVSQADLYGFPGAHAAELADAVVDAREIDRVVAIAARVRSYAVELHRAGMAAEALCQVISALNDLISMQVIDLVADQHDLPVVPWCWLVFGSEGRLEQTLATDQDNGLIFAAENPAEAEHLRQRFLPFAQAVNQALDRCGFPLCRGDIMAGNPQWCLSLDEWKSTFEHWMDDSQPKAVMHATIFFDFRALLGDEALVSELRRWLLGRTGEQSLFMRLLAEDAMLAQPPLSWWRDFSFAHDEEHPHTIDLKVQGVTPFVDAARIFALSRGIAATNTAERLRQGLAAKGNDAEDAAAFTGALFHIQRVRLDAQLRGAVAGAPNRLDPDQLNELDRAVLKAAFKQAQRLQTRLRLDYDL